MEEPIETKIAEDATDKILVGIEETEEAPKEPPKRRLYFINEIVEWDLTKYKWTGCTKVHLRDKIMSSATELIRQIIRKQRLHTIYPGHDDGAFGDLLQTAWCQIERTLYKYRSRPHCRKCFNPDRPSDSALHEPSDRDYDIMTLDEVISKYGKCPKCGTKFTDGPLTDGYQGCFGGTETVIYRGLSKVFNMWCVAPDTLIYADRSIKTIDKAITFGARETYGMHGPVEIIAHMKKPVTEAIRVTTVNNYDITMSPEHKLWADDGEIGWKEAKDLKPGMLLGMQIAQDYFANQDDISDVVLKEVGKWSPPNNICADWSYLFGRILIDGDIGGAEISIDDNNPNRLIERCNGLGLSSKVDGGGIRLASNQVVEWFRKVGFDENWHMSRTIPSRLMRLSRTNIAALIRGILDSSGGTVCSSTREAFIDQVRMLLINFGILSNKTKKRSADGEVNYKLSIDKGDLDLLDGNHANNINRRKVYGLSSGFRSLHDKYGPGHLSAKSINGIINKHAKAITVGLAKNRLKAWNNWSSDIDYKYIVEKIKERSKDRDAVVWVPIKSIQNTLSELREISVDSRDHSYLANGFISSNSQVTRTVILAYIKKDGRDRKNCSSYMTYLDDKSKPLSDAMKRFMIEAQAMCEYNDDHLRLLEALQNLLVTDPKPHEGIISKLVEHSGLSRMAVTNFIAMIRARSMEFTDSPINRNVDPMRNERRRVSKTEYQEE